MSYAIIAPFVRPQAGFSGDYKTQTCLAPGACVTTQGPSAAKTTASAVVLLGGLTGALYALRQLLR